MQTKQPPERTGNQEADVKALTSYIAESICESVSSYLYPQTGAELKKRIGEEIGPIIKELLPVAEGAIFSEIPADAPFVTVAVSSSDHVTMDVRFEAYARVGRTSEALRYQLSIGEGNFWQLSPIPNAKEIFDDFDAVYPVSLEDIFVLFLRLNGMPL